MVVIKYDCSPFALCLAAWTISSEESAMMSQSTTHTFKKRLRIFFPLFRNVDKVPDRYRMLKVIKIIFSWWVESGVLYIY